jgi:hypothetical protein
MNRTKNIKNMKKKFKKLNCHPKNKTKKYTCYDDNTLVMFKTLWNKKHNDKIVSTDVLGIWSELQKKIPMCSDEKCWADKLNTKADPNIFSPKSPKDWETNKWLSNFDIEAVLKQYKEAYPNFDYLGPAPIDFDKILGSKCVDDKICKLNIADKLKNKINKIAFSINLDEHGDDGSHWVTLFVDLEKKFIFYFDSAGEDIPDEIQKLMDRIQEQCKALGIKMTQHDSEKMEHQEGETECGMYSLYCIINLLEGKHTIQYFKKHRIPDKDVERYRRIYFN